MKIDKIKNFVIALVLILVGTIVLTSNYVKSQVSYSKSDKVYTNKSNIVISDIKIDSNIHTTNIDGPNITGNTNLSFLVDLLPNNYFSFTFKIKNNSSIAYKLNTYNFYNTNDSNLDEITYYMTYADGSEIKSNDSIDSGTERTFKVYVSYDHPLDINSQDLKSYAFNIDFNYILKTK